MNPQVEEQASSRHESVGNRERERGAKLFVFRPYVSPTLTHSNPFSTLFTSCKGLNKHGTTLQILCNCVQFSYSISTLLLVTSLLLHASLVLLYCTSISSIADMPDVDGMATRALTISGCC
jgi:hypothetical protein